MANLPPGSANVVSLPVNSTWVFTPNPNAGSINSVSIWNTGLHAAYVGRVGCNQADGFPIPPGNRPVRLQNIGVSLYACSDVTVGSSVGTTNAAYTAGVTSIVSAASIATTSIAVGGTLVIGSTVNTSWEAVAVTAISASYTTFTTTALVSDHVSGQIIYSATALPTSVVVQAGML